MTLPPPSNQLNHNAPTSPSNTLLTTPTALPTTISFSEEDVMNLSVISAVSNKDERSSSKNVNFVPLKCVSCLTFTDHNEIDSIICHNHHDCKNYICATHLSHFGMNPHDGSSNNKLCYRCIAGKALNEPKKNFWGEYWHDYCLNVDYLMTTDYALDSETLIVGTILWILFPLEDYDGGMYREIIVKLPKKSKPNFFDIKFYNNNQHHWCELSGGYFFVGERRKLKAKVVNAESESIVAV